jgi:hypothetical protein
LSEYMLVESPVVFPQACVCGSQKGPLVDTFITTGGNRIYICTACVKRCAKQLGLVKGPRMEELLNAGELLDAATKEIGDREKIMQSQAAENASIRRKNEALEELLSQERDRQRTQQALVQMIHENSSQLLTVGNGA